MTRLGQLVCLILFCGVQEICTAQYIVQFPVSQPDLLEANAGGSAAVLAGTILTLGGQPAAIGGTPPYSYSWTPTHGLNDPTLPNPVLTADSAVTYNLKVTDAQSCTANSTIHVSIVIGLDDEAREDEVFSIFPNPVDGNVFFVKYETSAWGEDYTLIIRTLTGQVVFTATLSGELSALSRADVGIQRGTYLVAITTRQEHHLKLIVL